jgi:hypothetical protein
MFQRAFSVTPRQASRAYAVRASLPAVRQLHATPVAFKTTTEKVAEVADKVCTDSETRKDLTGLGVEGQQVCWPGSGFCHRDRRASDREDEADSR